jgi:hypothetical protein
MTSIPVGRRPWWWALVDWAYARYLRKRLQWAEQDRKQKWRHQLQQAREIVVHDKFIAATKRKLAQLGVHD